MFHACTFTPDTKADPQNPPYLKAPQSDSFSTGEFATNNYTRYSEISQGSQNSFFTPSASSNKKPPVLDDITNLLKNVQPKRLDFSASLDTSGNKNLTPNYVLKKLETDKALNMDIEDTEPVENMMDSEKVDENTYGSTMMDGFINNTQKWKKNKPKPLSNASLSQDYQKPKQMNPSLIKRWKKNDKIFQGKYSTGATPKWTKNTPQGSIPLSLIPFKRCNTDVPPTFESDKLLMTGEKSEIGANKYINNLLSKNDISKQRELILKGPMMSLKQIQSKQIPQNPKAKNLPNFSGPKLSGLSKPKLLRDFPLDFTQGNLIQKSNSITEPGLFLIPERNVELEGLSFFPGGQPNPDVTKNDFVSKLLTFEEEDDDQFNDGQQIESIDQIGNMRCETRHQDFKSPNENGRQDQFYMSPAQKKEYHTPTKDGSPLSEVKFNFFNSATARKEAQSKLFTKDFEADSVKPFDHVSGRKSFDDIISETEEFGHYNRSRFDLDYEVLEVLGSGYFGTVYKCQNRLDGLIYAIKCTKNKLKGQNNISQALNEAQALASLSVLDENPFIVRYYSAWIEDDRLYLAMEHCQSNLKALRHQHIRFSESMIRQIMRDICMGLRHLHNQKIVHLDIKPENILYSKTKKYKIADLGLSRIAQRSNNEDINEGDCRYLAPELLKDYPDTQLPDLTKADIFSFGATIYELMIGNDLPRNGKEWLSLRDGNLVKLDQLNYSNSLKSMLRSMMSNNPDHRPSAHELLTNFLQSEIELELKWEKKQNKILKERVKELEDKLRTKRKNSM